MELIATPLLLARVIPGAGVVGIDLPRGGGGYWTVKKLADGVSVACLGKHSKKSALSGLSHGVPTSGSACADIPKAHGVARGVNQLVRCNAKPLCMVMYRTAADLRVAFDNQIAALKASCTGFDVGNRWEAARIAAVVYILLHDGGRKNRSLLTQLRARDGLEFIAPCGGFSAQNLLPSSPLTMVRVSSDGGVHLPILAEMPEGHVLLKFGRWWDREPIYSAGSNRHLMTRKQLVFALRNKEGGAHYDEKNDDEDFEKMATTGTGMFALIEGRKPQRLDGLQHAVMRQIGWEVLETLKRAGLDDSSRANAA